MYIIYIVWMRRVIGSWWSMVKSQGRWDLRCDPPTLPYVRVQLATDGG